MLWLLMAVAAVAGGILMLRRRRHYEAPQEEPWRDSLADDDEPLDIDEIREAEDEWLAESDWQDPPEDDWNEP